MLNTASKRERRRKICGSIARQRVRQTKNHERVNMTSAHTIHFFFLLLLYSSFVLFSLVRTFCDDDRAHIRISFSFLSWRNWTRGRCNICFDQRNVREKKKKKKKRKKPKNKKMSHLRSKKKRMKDTSNIQL